MRKIYTYGSSISACLFVLFFILASVSGCEKTDNAPNYPYNIGSKWMYAVYDSILQLGYTETVEITDTTQLKNGMNAKVFKHTFSFNKDSTDYSFLTENADTLTFWIINKSSMSAMTTYLTDRIYVYPIKVGSHWHTYLAGDSSKVVSNENAIVSAGNFNTLKITRLISEPNYSFSENEWYSLSIGMIRRDYFTRNLGWTECKSYQLISYKLK